MKLVMCVATMQPFDAELEHVNSWMDRRYDTDVMCSIRNNTASNNKGVVGSYEWLYRLNEEADVLAYIHDDVVCYEQNWDKRVLAEFDNPKVGLVGFGGGLRHGHPDIYKIPYDYRQLARFGYRSNTRDAEIHGERFKGACNVAVLDGFGLVVRRELLDRVQGWPVQTPIGYIAYDYWACCTARRLGYEVRMVGVDCQHLGGRTFVSMNMGNDSSQVQYAEAHRYIYDEFRDVLPCQVGETDGR